MKRLFLSLLLLMMATLIFSQAEADDPKVTDVNTAQEFVVKS